MTSNMEDKDKEKEIKSQTETEIKSEPEVTEITKEDKPFSLVSMASNQKKLSFIIFVLLIAGVLYYFLFTDSSTSDKKADNTSQIDKTEKKKIFEEAKSIPETEDSKDIKSNDLKDKPIQVPEVEAPEPPPPLPSLSLPKLDKSQESKSMEFSSPFSDDEAEKKKQMAMEAKMKAGIMVTGGGSSGGILDGDKDDKKKEKTSSNSSGFLGFGDGHLDGETLGGTTFPKVKATAVNHLSRTILQGKIISAILETAINTDIPGMLRAIIIRDVYAEKGNDIMIQKGSRLIGQYSSAVKGGQTRVAVMWERLIRPDGIDIAIASPGVDPLGRSGIAGNVYDHFWRRLGNAFLVSYVIPVASARAAEKATNKKKSGDSSTSSTTTNKDGSVTVTTTGTGDPTEQAIKDSTKQFSDITKQMVEDSFSTKPTLTVNQGTMVNVLVQKDLIFPPQSVLQKRDIYK